MSERLRVVIDTSVWIDIYLRGAITDATQPYKAIFDALVDDEFEPVVSRPTYDEVKYMLTESKLAKRRIDTKHALMWIESLYFASFDLVVIPGTLRVCSDPKDDMFIETAIVGGVKYLVRDDRDLREPAVHAILNANNVRAVFPQQFRRILEARRAAKK